MERSLLPIGVDNFHKLITHRDPRGHGYLFVDKSLLIQDFLQAGDDVGLITRPRRFGKTINMSMLQHFFAAEVSGQPTNGLFDGLAISKHPEVMKEQGQWPVVFLSLKDAKGSTFHALLESMQGTIGKLYRSHEYLLDSQQLSEHHISLFSKYAYGTTNNTSSKQALSSFIELLYKHTGKQVIVLVDEYDTPLHQAYIHGYYEEGKEFMTAFLGSALKGNDYLKKALVTGILKVAKASLFSGLNNFQVYSVLDSLLYSQYFGFTDQETDDLLDRAKLPQQAHQLKELYNGYQIGESILYNPWSIISFIKHAQIEGPEKALKPYWVNTASDEVLKELLRENLTALEPKLTQLFQGNPIEEPINTDIVFDKNLWGGELKFWSIMLLSGYLKVIDQRFDTVLSQQRYTLLFPNKEISGSIQQLLLGVLAGSTGTAYSQAIRELVVGDVQQFATFLKTYLQDATSVFDSGKGTGQNLPERFYKGLLLGITAALYQSFRVTSEGEGRDGRYDIAIVPRDVKAHHRGIILELKVGQSTEGLKQLAAEALAQIIAKGYDQPLRDQGATEIVRLGIAFHKKQAEIVVG